MIFNSWNVQSVPAIKMEKLVDRLIGMCRDIEELHQKNFDALNPPTNGYSLTTRKETS